jgi:hypothetical protein
LLALNYFSFTTLTTVGFGDFHPRSDVERLFITFQMLIGVAIFSYFLGDFISIIGSLVVPPSETDEDELAMFFGLIKYFNM